MTWVRIEPDAMFHPKLVQIGPRSVHFWLGALCYSNRHMTDGFIPDSALSGILPGLRRARALPLVATLVKAGLWLPVEGGWHIHDFDKYQPTKAEVLAERERAHAIRVAGGQARASTAQRIAGRFAHQQPTSSPAGAPAGDPSWSNQPAGHQHRSVPIRKEERRTTGPVEIGHTPNGGGGEPVPPEVTITPDEERGLPYIAFARGITVAQCRSELLTAKLREREGRR